MATIDCCHQHPARCFSLRLALDRKKKKKKNWNVTEISALFDLKIIIIRKTFFDSSIQLSITLEDLFSVLLIPYTSKYQWMGLFILLIDHSIASMLIRCQKNVCRMRGREVWSSLLPTYTNNKLTKKESIPANGNKSQIDNKHTYIRFIYISFNWLKFPRNFNQ